MQNGASSLPPSARQCTKSAVAVDRDGVEARLFSYASRLHDAEAHLFERLRLANSLASVRASTFNLIVCCAKRNMLQDRSLVPPL